MGEGQPAIPIEELLLHEDWVRALARRLLGDETLVDEVVQETWLAALTRPVGELRNPRAWLARVVSNLSLRMRRDDGRRRGFLKDPELEPPRALDPSDLLEHESVRRRLVEQVLKLEEPYQTTVLQHAYQELPFQTMARLSGEPVATVRTRWRRALDQLRERCKREEFCGVYLWALLPAFVNRLPLDRGSGPAAAGTPRAMLFGAAALATTVIAVGMGVSRARDVDPDPVRPAEVAGREQARDDGNKVPEETASTRVSASAPPGAAAVSETVAETRVRGAMRWGQDLWRAPIWASNQPVQVDLYPGFDAFDQEAPSDEPERTLTLLTDDEGRFELDVPNDRSFTVYAHPLVEGAIQGPSRAGAKLFVPQGEPPQRDLEVRVFKLNAWVSGRVSDQDGIPLPDARISLHGEVHPVDPDGSYRLATSSQMEDVPLHAWAPGHAEVRRIVKPAAGAERTLDLRLPRELAVHGYVRDEKGFAISGALLSTRIGHAPATTSREDGSFDLPHLAPEWHAGLPQRIVIQRDGYARATRSVDDLVAPREEAVVELSREASATGQVIDAQTGEPIPGVYLTLGTFDGAQEPYETTSRGGGMFRFDGVQPGAWSLLAQHPRHAPKVTELLVHAAPASPAYVELEPGDRIEGAVLGETGKPLRDAQVRVRFQPKELRHPLVLDATARTDAEGRFELTGVPRADAVLLLYHRQAHSKQVPVQDVAHPTNAKFYLSPKPHGTLRGRVVDASSGAPVTSFRVSLFRTGSGPDQVPLGPQRGFAFTDPDGLWVGQDFPALIVGETVGIRVDQAAGFETWESSVVVEAVTEVPVELAPRP